MKKVIFGVLICISNLLYSQNITCLYELRFRPNQNKDSLVSNTFYLDIYGKQSIFRSELERKSDSLTEKSGLGLGRNMFFISIGEKLNWKIINEKQKIGDLYCQKAEADYGGRHWTAWFTESVNLHEGPYIFNGLPGLIVKISDSQLDYDFNLIQLKNAAKRDFFIPPTGQKISWQDFQKIMQNYYDDPFYELKSSGMKYTVGDDQGNVSTLSPKTIVKKFQTNLKDYGNNLLETDKALTFK